MKLAGLSPAILCLPVLLVAGCSSNLNTWHSIPATCATTPDFEFAYALTGNSVSMFTVNSCNGEFSASTPNSISTGYASPPGNAEELVADPLGRFAYVANLVSNASDLSTISSFTINPTTGVLTPTSPATVHTGWFPQSIAIDPKGRFVYTANSDDATVSMFTINQTSGVLTPTSPATVSTMVSGQLLSDPSFLPVDPTGQYLYVTALLSDGAAVFMYTINQTTGLLTPSSPATVMTGGIPGRSSSPPTEPSPTSSTTTPAAPTPRASGNTKSTTQPACLYPTRPPLSPPATHPRPSPSTQPAFATWSIATTVPSRCIPSIPPPAALLTTHPQPTPPAPSSPESSPSASTSIPRKIPLRHQRGRPHLHLHRQRQRNPHQHGNHGSRHRIPGHGVHKSKPVANPTKQARGHRARRPRQHSQPLK